MKKTQHLLTAFLLSFFLPFQIFSQGFEWANLVELHDLENAASILWLGNDVENDNDGNVYMTGNFVGTQKFGDTILVSSGLSSGPITVFSDDGFIAKYSPQGEFQWVEVFPATLFGNVYDIEVDDSGNIYALMHFIDTIKVLGTEIIADEGFVVAKIDAQLNLIWYNTITRDGSQNFMFPGTLEISDTDVFVTGLAQDEVTMDGVILNENHDYILVSINNQNGSYNWSKNFEANSGGLATDAGGNVYLTTNYNQYLNITFEGIPIDGTNGPVMILAKFDLAGNAIWVKTINNGVANPGYITEIDVDKTSGDFYATGTWGDTLNIDGTQVIGSSISNLGGLLWIAKFNSSGQIQWIKTSDIQPNTSGGIENKFIHLETSQDGGVFVSTEHSGAGLILGEGSNQILFDNLLDGFVAKYSSNGEFEWAQKIFCTGADCSTFIRGLTAVGGNQAVISGSFSTTLDLGPQSITTVVPGTVEQQNIFLTKIDGDLMTSSENFPTKQLQFDVFPNPSVGLFQMKIEDEQFIDGNVEVSDLNGNIILNQKIQGDYQELVLNHLPAGAYLLRLLGKEKLGIKLLVIAQ